MRWDNVQFSAADLIRICVQVVLGAVFIMMMKADIRVLSDGLAGIKEQSKEDQERNRTWQNKTDAEYGEMKVRVAILEQKVTELQISRDQNK